MAGGKTFNLAEEFAGVDFNEERLEKRFRRTMETPAKQPENSVYGSSANRAEAKAIYALTGNEKFEKGEIRAAHRTATIRRMEGHPIISAVQDTTSVNYDRQQGRQRIYQCLCQISGALSQNGARGAYRRRSVNRPVRRCRAFYFSNNFRFF